MVHKYQKHKEKKQEVLDYIKKNMIQHIKSNYWYFLKIREQSGIDHRENTFSLCLM